MSDATSTVGNLGKRYSLRHQKKMFGRSDNANDATREEFWRLRGVSFQLQHGEVVGFIGWNGAGKSTLLEILSWITDSVAGRVGLCGCITRFKAGIV